MKQENKELLCKDLCARLPYGVKCDIHNYEDSYYDSHEHVEIHLKEKKPIKISGIDFNKDCIYLSDSQIDHVCGFENYGDLKPYLRPMSSMTEEEIKEYKHLVAFSGSADGAANMVDWLNKKMFAYRTIDGKDMFKLGLALEAPEGMYEY